MKPELDPRYLLVKLASSKEDVKRDNASINITVNNCVVDVIASYTSAEAKTVLKNRGNSETLFADIVAANQDNLIEGYYAVAKILFCPGRAGTRVVQSDVYQFENGKLINQMLQQNYLDKITKPVARKR